MEWIKIKEMVGKIVGKKVGGLIKKLINWKWILIIKVKIGMIGIWFEKNLMKDNEERIIKRIDWKGLLI